MSGYRESHLAKGAEYHLSFSKLPHRSMVWSLERRLVLGIVKNSFPDSRPTHLDFASGTGRFLELLAPLSSTSTGVDLSESMLRVARQRLRDVEFVEGDITRDDVLDDREFDLITAFRFFANAEPDLKWDALEVLKRHLAPDGILVFNNHLNRHSLLRTTLRVMNRHHSHHDGTTEWGMSREETYQLVGEAGLRVEDEYPLAILPFTDRHMFWPKSVLERIELNLARVSLLTPLAQNLVYVCRAVR